MGLVAETFQAPMLMYLEYKLTLPDHNFLVGLHHNLILSVYGVSDMSLKGEVSYSGETFIHRCRGKREKSSAKTHAYDMHELFKSAKVVGKPVLLKETDGAQDEVP